MPCHVGRVLRPGVGGLLRNHTIPGVTENEKEKGDLSFFEKCVLCQGWHRVIMLSGRNSGVCVGGGAWTIPRGFNRGHHDHYITTALTSTSLL